MRIAINKALTPRQNFIWSMLVFIIISSDVLAQEVNDPRFTLELTGGMSLTTMRGDAKVEDGRNLGVGTIVGIEVNYNINDRLVLKSGFYYDHKKTNQNIDYYYLDATTQSLAQGEFIIIRTFDYITTPLLFHYNFKGSESGFRPFIETGGWLGFLIDQSSTNYSGGVANITYNELNDFKKLDLGLSLAVGGKFILSRSITGNARILNNFGLKNINGVDTKSVFKTNSVYVIFSVSKRI